MSLSTTNKYIQAKRLKSDSGEGIHQRLADGFQKLWYTQVENMVRVHRDARQSSKFPDFARAHQRSGLYE